MKKLIITISLILSLLLGLVTIYKVRHQHKFEEVDSGVRQTYINYLNRNVINGLEVNYTSSKPEIRALLEDELNFGGYIYKESGTKTGGYSIAMCRYINVSPNLAVEKYCAVLCHEMCHVKYFTDNEIYTNFMAFKHLYESDSPELKQAGTWFGIHILNREYEHRYDCSKLIVDYLGNIE